MHVNPFGCLCILILKNFDKLICTYFQQNGLGDGYLILFIVFFYFYFFYILPAQ